MLGNLRRSALSLILSVRKHFLGKAKDRGRFALFFFVTSKNERLLTWYRTSVDPRNLLLQKSDGTGLGPVPESREAVRLVSVLEENPDLAILQEKDAGISLSSTLRGLGKMEKLWGSAPHGLESFEIAVQLTPGGRYYIVDGRHRAAMWCHVRPTTKIPCRLVLFP